MISKSGEGQSTSVAARQLGYETVAGNQIFKQSMMVTEEYNDRGQYDAIKREAEDLGKATIETLNIFAAQPFIEGLNLSL